MGQTCGEFGGIRRSDGAPCGWPAGRKTDHLGTGKCAKCCRFGGGRPRKDGITPALKDAWSDKIQAYLDNPSDLQDLSMVAAVYRVALDEFRAAVPPGDSIHTDELTRLSAIMEGLGKAVSRQAEVTYKESLTARQVQQLREAWIAAAYAVAPDRETADAWLLAWTRAIGLPAALPSPTITVEVIDSDST